jgi:hypothetical protein
VTYHLVATYDGANQRLYVNGTQAASRAQTGSASVGSGSLGIGFRGGTSEYFNGTIDEAAVYNKALSATRVDAHTAAGGRPSSIASAKSRTKKPRLRHRHTRDRLGPKARRGHRGHRGHKR